jgi:hypothetical protein
VFGASIVAALLVVRARTNGRYRFCFLAALLFWLPVFLFRSPYAALAGLTLAHGFEYLILIGAVTAGAPRKSSWEWDLVGLALIGLAGGAVLSVASHLHSAVPSLRILFGAYVGVVMSHFVVDGRLWRLRDGFPRRFLGTRLPRLLRGHAADLP